MKITASLLAGLTFLGCASLPALAQDTSASQPRTLAPRDFNDQPSEAQAPTPVPMRSISGGIQVKSLDRVNQEAFGALSGADALPSNMWAGTPRGLVENTLKALPANPGLPSLTHLQRRLLLSAATPPKGTGSSESFLALRSAKLAEMGQNGDVQALIDAAPKAERESPALSRLQASALLLSGEYKEACRLGVSALQENTDAFWVKLVALCQTLAKQHNKAALSLSLLQESGANAGELYLKLLEALKNDTAVKLDKLLAPGALEVALVRLNSVSFSENLEGIKHPNSLRILLSAQKVPPALRTKAALEAFAQQLINRSTLEKAFDSLKFSEAQKKNPLESAQKLDPLSAQALLYQLVSTPDQLEILRGEAISLAMELAEKTDYAFEIKRLYGPSLATIEARADLMWLAPQAIRSLLLAQNWEAAQKWYATLRSAAFANQEIAKEWTAVRPLAALAGFDVSDQAIEQMLKGWWQSLERTPDAYRQGAFLASLLDGLGHRVPEGYWGVLVSGPMLAYDYAPKPGFAIKMNKAALNARLGETVVSVLGTLGGAPVLSINPVFYRDSLFALRMVELKDEARLIAINAALRAGF